MSDRAGTSTGPDRRSREGVRRSSLVNVATDNFEVRVFERRGTVFHHAQGRFDAASTARGSGARCTCTLNGRWPTRTRRRGVDFAARPPRSDESRSTDCSSSCAMRWSGVPYATMWPTWMAQTRVGLLGFFEVVRRQQDGRAALRSRTRPGNPTGCGAMGSSPRVGSSRNSTRGRCIRLRMISSLRRIPPEKVFSGLNRILLDAQSWPARDLLAVAAGINLNVGRNG